MNSLPPSRDTDRDPVGVAIEALLADMQSRGMGSLQTTADGGKFTVTFNEMHGEGNTLDIALVRLASAMMSDTGYTQLLMDALGPSMREQSN